MGEWALIIFTFIMQGAIGAYLWGTIMKSRKSGADLGKNALVVLALTVIGMLTSLGHLGDPLGALRSLLNLGSSWLSREIFFSGGFLVLLIVSILFDRAKTGSDSVRQGLNWLTSLVGLIAVLSMAEIYMQSIMPAWQSWNTLVEFYAATLVLGGVIFLLTSAKEVGGELPRMDLVLLAVVLLQAAFTPNFLAGLGGGDLAAQTSAGILSAEYGVLMAVKWLLILGGVFLSVLYFNNRAEKSGYLYTSAAAVAIGFLIGRYLFYAAGVAMGIGLV